MGQAKHMMMDAEEKWCDDVVNILDEGYEDFNSFKSEVFSNLTHPKHNFEECDIDYELSNLWEEMGYDYA